jgi:hypothetical protein
MKHIGGKIPRALLALWLCGGASAAAQEQNPAPQEAQATKVNCKTLGLTDNLNEVNEKRDTITAERTVLQQQSLRLKDEIQVAPSAALIESRRQERAALLGKPKKTDADWKRIEELDDSDVKNKDQLRAEMRAAEAALNTKNEEARCVQQAINSFYTPQQSFKQTMSILFAVLIGLVIIGFFVLSYADKTVRRAIFSGQTGIQFLTLFSIVIAIILFGITSILGDKELSALLGGLSGYILGRYTGGGRSRSPAAPEAEPA